MQRSTFSHNSKNQHCCCCNFEIAPEGDDSSGRRAVRRCDSEPIRGIRMVSNFCSEMQNQCTRKQCKAAKNVIITRAKPWIIPQVTVISLYIFSSHVTDYIHLHFVIKLRNNVWNHCCQRTAVRTLCCPAERMWILWQPPYAYNTQRLSEKWTACGDLPGFTSRRSTGGHSRV